MTTVPTNTLEELRATANGETFTIQDERSAVWLLRKLRAIHAEREAIKAATAQRLHELDADENRLNHLYSDQLQTWAREESQRRRRKTVTLPLAGASVAFRSSPAHLEIENTVTASEIAITLGLTKPVAADLTAYKKAAEKALEERGELLPGVAMTEACDTFAIRFATAKNSGQDTTEE